jgi:hypothetical protein
MARTEARLFVSIWRDPDWRELTQVGQWLYGAVLLTQPDLSYCGVLPYAPRRWAGLARGVTVKGVTKALVEIERKQMIVVDRNTEEVWIRTLVKNDGILQIPNLRKSMADAFVRVQSEKIRRGLAEGLPQWLGQQFDQEKAERYAQEFAERVGQALPYPLPLTPLPFPDSPSQLPRETSSSSTNGGRAPVPDDAKDLILSDTWALMAYRRMERRGGDPIIDKAAYMRKTVRELAKEFTSQAMSALELDPTIDAQNLAYLLDVSSAEGRPPCENCDTTGWVPSEDDLGGQVACPKCNNQRAVV